jgi:serine protease Do
VENFMQILVREQIKRKYVDGSRFRRSMPLAPFTSCGDSQSFSPRHRGLIGWLTALAMLVAFLLPGMARASTLLTPESRRDLELQPGVVLILVQFKATLGQWSVTPGVLGSGFLYRPDGYLVTNGHVAQLANEKDTKADVDRIKMAAPMVTAAILKDEAQKLGRALTDEEQGKLIDALEVLIRQGKMDITNMTLTVYLSNGASYQGEIKAYSDPIDEGGKDVAIIKIDGKNLPTVALGNSDDVNVGDPLTVIGYPGDLTNATLSGQFSARSALIPTVTSGRISAVNKSDYRGTPVLQSDTTINHGNSGGPAFDNDGNVVGIATYSLNNAKTGSSGLNFFVPINTAMEFVHQAGADPQRGPFDQLWHSALDAYAGQHWSQAHDLMGSVLEMMPNQPDAAKLQLQSAQNMHAENPVMAWVDRLGIGVVVAIAVGLLLLLIVLIFLIVRNPAKPESHATVPLPQRPAEPPPVAVAAVATPAKPVLPNGDSFGSLYIASGPLSGNRFHIPQKGLLIGRDPSLCTVVLPDDTVSKEHAWVVPLDNGVAVIDRSSANGTYVNSTESPRIAKMVLKNGDRIFIGRKNPTEITYFA